MFKMFDTKPSVIEQKFLGLYAMVILAIVSIFQGIDLVTGFLGGVIAMMIRDLYRTDTKEGV